MKPILRKIDVNQNHSFLVIEETRPYFDERWFYHPEIELTHIRRGNGMRFIGDSVDRFSDGELILLGADLPHMWRCDDTYYQGDPDVNIEISVIQFREDFWGAAILNLPEMKDIKDLLEKVKRGIRIYGETRSKVLQRMSAIPDAKGAERLENLIGILNIIATSEEYEVLSSIGFTKSYDHRNSDRINQIYNYTLNNFQNPISLKDVAAAVNINPHSFCRYFKASTFKTYWDFLLEVRVGYACKLLIENKMNVSQICYACGFNTLSNFNRQFKSITGKTPVQYMNEYNPGRKKSQVAG